MTTFYREKKKERKKERKDQMNVVEENTSFEESVISPYVTLISSDGFSFTVTKEAASTSGTLKNMISDTFEEGMTNTIKLHDIDGSILEKVVEYLYYNQKYKNCVDVPEFYVPTEMALELLVAADFLHV